MLELGLFFLFISVVIILWLAGWPWLKVQLTDDEPLWWPWIVFISPWCKPLLTWRMRQRFNTLQLKTGLQEYWQAELWLGHKLLLAFSLAFMFAGIALYLAIATRFILLLFICGAVAGYMLPEVKLHKQVNLRKLKMQTELPFMLDLLTLCVQAGLSLSMALQRVAEYSPAGPLRDSLQNSRNLERTGLDRAGWLGHWAETTELEGVQNLVLALIQADQMGMNLGPVLQAQAEQQRSSRFIRAEKLALQAPVKMLLPMVLCIFPCTFLIIGFPILVKLLEFNF